MDCWQTRVMLPRSRLLRKQLGTTTLKRPTGTPASTLLVRLMTLLLVVVVVVMVMVGGCPRSLREWNHDERIGIPSRGVRRGHLLAWRRREVARLRERMDAPLRPKPPRGVQLRPSSKRELRLQSHRRRPRAGELRSFDQLRGHVTRMT